MKYDPEKVTALIQSVVKDQGIAALFDAVEKGHDQPDVFFAAKPIQRPESRGVFTSINLEPSQDLT